MDALISAAMQREPSKRMSAKVMREALQEKFTWVASDDESNSLRRSRLILDVAPKPLQKLFEKLWNDKCPEDRWDDGSAAAREESALLLLKGSRDCTIELPWKEQRQPDRSRRCRCVCGWSKQAETRRSSSSFTLNHFRRKTRNREDQAPQWQQQHGQLLDDRWH